jgi:RNA polymerase sigma-70 factor (ECF subfamily)
MDLTLDDDSVAFLLHEAAAAAKRTCKRLGLATHHMEDVCQDLLVDLLARLPAYRRNRGSLGAFANVVFRNKASRLGDSIRRERAVLGLLISIDEPIDGDEGPIIGATIPDSAGYPAMFGQQTDWGEEAYLRVSVFTGLARLTAKDRSLSVALSESTVDELVGLGLDGRSTLYRRLDRIRLDLTAFGVGPV